MRYFLFCLGIISSVIGLSYIIIYLNLLIMGFNIFDYLKYIFTNFECLLFFLGYFLLMWIIRKPNNKRKKIQL